MGSKTTWTWDQKKRFESALVADENLVDGDEGKWERIANAVGDGKTIEDIKIHFEDLIADLNAIESGAGPESLRHYRFNYSSGAHGENNEAEYKDEDEDGDRDENNEDEDEDEEGDDKDINDKL
ncbi:hypothetical protein LIER_19169 [Lithospermum erythrorhizon]|uniref:Myb-like domain-containing protein n=1 Tax=Lithospermum erythrorhizon TaxID=34254 RepID=A0AAV3QIA6_LITER